MGVPELQGQPQKAGTNWVKCGCVGCVVAVFLSILGGGACFYGVVRMIKSSDAYQMTEKLAKESPVVRRELGEVTGFGFMPIGSVNKDASGMGHAELSVSVTGTKGTGTVAITASAAGDRWRFTSATLATPDGRVLPLLGGQSSGGVEATTGPAIGPAATP